MVQFDTLSAHLHLFPQKTKNHQIPYRRLLGTHYSAITSERSVVFGLSAVIGLIARTARSRANAVSTHDAAPSPIWRTASPVYLEYIYRQLS